MTNRIVRVDLIDHSVIPGDVEVHVQVTPARLDAGTEVRGRFMGPRCHYASTVEVAYHLRPLTTGSDTATVTLRALIPEASFWEPIAPHLYIGLVELWQDGQRVDRVEVTHGLRRISISSKGLRVNGHIVQLRGRSVTSLSDSEANLLRQQGVQLLVVPVKEETLSLWQHADLLGFFVLGRLAPDCPAERIDTLARHCSTLGWIHLREESLPVVPAGTYLGVEGEATGGDFRLLRAGEVVDFDSSLPVLLSGTTFDQARSTWEGPNPLLGVLEE